jgi:tRNA uridine 5-carboxymethylaminomethyl modification enzyme
VFNLSLIKAKDEYIRGEYDVAIVGAGHAGCEAALAASRMGCKTVLFATNLESIALMACNPSIGGTAKGHLVREIDALGGEMGKNIDKTMVQCKMLNTSKGPAVHSLRAQADRKMYHMEMKKTLEEQENLDIVQAEVTDIITEDSKIIGLKTFVGAIFKVKSLVLATGTYLKGRIIIGNMTYSGGPDGLFPANKLSDSLLENGIKLMRFKTGTPARISKLSIDTNVMEVQKGDEPIVPFSFETDEINIEQMPCWLIRTTEETHQIIKDNLDRSPLYSGIIEGVGPRYCPSIEDKIVKFADKKSHQIFLEPMGRDTNEIYVQGFSSSMPEEVQLKMLKSLPGFKDVKMMRTAYAIEYDCIDPLQLKPSLEFKEVGGLFAGGQINGSSGYEEAGAQGLVAGINAALKVLEKEPLILDRADGYIGVLIDDLVTKGTKEPYRMMTSRAEYRLHLRQDNADKRLTPLGKKVGLISEGRYKKYLAKQEAIEKEFERIKSVNVAPSIELNQYLESKDTAPLNTGVKLSDLIKRPQLSYNELAFIDTERLELSAAVCEEVEILTKYEGYIKAQLEQVEQFKKLEFQKLAEDFDYASISGLRLEARQKLNSTKPLNLGQASRISGVSPADISVLMIWLEQQRRGRGESSNESK